MKHPILFILALCTAISTLAAPPHVIAHRGFWKADGSTQNSIRSLIKADSIGCYGSEFDVWLTTDSVLVVNHNQDIQGHVIQTSPYAEIADLRLPNGEVLPTLDAYLEAAKPLKVELILELKFHADTLREDIAVDRIIEMVAEKGLTNRVTYISFSKHACRLFAEKSGRPVYLLTGSDPDEVAAMGVTGPDFHISHFQKNPAWLPRFQQAGMPVNVWTLNKPEQIQWCILNNIDFITTDQPEMARSLIEEAREN